MNNSVEFYIHFDGVDDKHEINSQSLLIFLEAHHKIAKHFGIHTDVKIGAPEQGSWGTKIILTIGLIFGLDSMGITTVVTGKSIKEWITLSPQKKVEKVNEFIITEPKNIPDGEMTNELRECIEQKNKIYTQFIKDKCINSFDLDKYPSIPRNNFQLYIKELPDKDCIYLGKTDIVVSSPDWKGNRSWCGNIEILEDTKSSSFNFDKNLTGKFWEKVTLDVLSLHTTTDTMSVQLVEKPMAKVKYQVIRVLSYNDTKIDDELSDSDIEKIALLDSNKKTAQKKQDKGQISLFLDLPK
jgi:hypothetical protein